MIKRIITVVLLSILAYIFLRISISTFVRMYFSNEEKNEIGALINNLDSIGIIFEGDTLYFKNLNK